jgi:hypothetical protein
MILLLILLLLTLLIITLILIIAFIDDIIDIDISFSPLHTLTLIITPLRHYAIDIDAIIDTLIIIFILLITAIDIDIDIDAIDY